MYYSLFKFTRMHRYHQTLVCKLRDFDSQSYSVTNCFIIGTADTPIYLKQVSVKDGKTLGLDDRGYYAILAKEEEFPTVYDYWVDKIVRSRLSYRWIFDPSDDITKFHKMLWEV